MEDLKGLFIFLAFFAFFYPMIANKYRKSCGTECKDETRNWLIVAIILGLIGLAL